MLLFLQERKPLLMAATLPYTRRTAPCPEDKLALIRLERSPGRPPSQHFSTLPNVWTGDNLLGWRLRCSNSIPRFNGGHRSIGIDPASAIFKKKKESFFLHVTMFFLRAFRISDPIYHLDFSGCVVDVFPPLQFVEGKWTHWRFVFLLAVSSAFLWKRFW